MTMTNGGGWSNTRHSVLSAEPIHVDPPWAEPVETKNETFVLTNQLRWTIKTTKMDFLMITVQVLQQLWKGDLGTEEWRDVPTVHG